MQPSEALSASAQVAVTLAGFAGVVVAFRSGSVHEWSKLDKFRLEVLLVNSALPFMLSIFALLLLATELNEVAVWRWCSLVAFVGTVVTGQFIARGFRGLPREQIYASTSRRWIFFSSGVIGIVATLLQLYNVIRLQTFWPFLTCISTWLWLAMIQFILLVTARHDQIGDK
jgi:hypothetical protein